MCFAVIPLKIVVLKQSSVVLAEIFMEHVVATENWLI